MNIIIRFENGKPIYLPEKKPVNHTRHNKKERQEICTECNCWWHLENHD